jgi:hypothetical protein
MCVLASKPLVIGYQNYCCLYRMSKGNRSDDELETIETFMLELH